MIHKREHGKPRLFPSLFDNFIVGYCELRYDKHRDEILRGAGSDYKDSSMNLMPFFTTSCFVGYGDDAKVDDL